MIRLLVLFSLIVHFSFADETLLSETSSIENNATLHVETADESEFEDEFENEEGGFEDEFKDEFAPQKQVFDPLEGYNRAMTTFNDYSYMYVLDPLAKGYKSIIPDDIRQCVSNFFDNLATPTSILNNLLQGKFKRSGTELTRFVLNSTLGLGGLGDFSKDVLGIEKHQEDFGQTLGFYGVGRGFPVVLPLLGPSNMRDLTGFVGDYFTNPKVYLNDIPLSMGLSVYERFNLMSLNAQSYEEIRENAIDLYPFLQNFYEQYRQKQISE